jgi:hypothetical protein
MSISVAALRVVAIHRLPLGRLEAFKSLVLYLYDRSSLQHCGIHNPQGYLLRSTLQLVVRVGQGPSEDRFTWRVMS